MQRDRSKEVRGKGPVNPLMPLVLVLSALILAGCSARPDATYYQDLYYLVYRVRHALEPVGWYPDSLEKDTRAKLQSEMDGFLTTHKRFKHLRTYYLLGCVRLKFGGGNFGGELGMDERTETSVLMQSFLDGFFSGYGYEKEPMKYGVNLDMTAIEQRAIDSLKEQQH